MSETEIDLGDLFSDLDRSGPIPLYYQVGTRIEEAIRSGRLPAGARLENEIALSERLGISRPTIRRAIQDVVDKGLLVRRRGIGTQVVHGEITRQVELSSLHEDIERSGRRSTTRLLLREEVAADEAVAARLNVPVGSPVLHLRRVRCAEDTPVAILENHLPADFLDIGEAALGSSGLYQLLRARGTTMRVARERIGARRATRTEAGLLELDSGAPVLTMERTAFDHSGRAVEFGQHCYRPDMHSFEVTLVDR